ELNEEIAILNLSNMMSAEELLNNSNEKIVYEMPDNDKIIENLVELYKQPLNIQTDINEEDIDDSVEPLIVSANSALKSLEIVHSFLQQQEDSKDLLKSINTFDRYINLKIINKMKQTTLGKFFS
ncbi:17016_t:CDS:1, partial [Cetraspora pellucida]